MHVERLLVDGHVRVDADHPGEDVALRMVVGLGRRDLALVDHLLDQGVVLGQRTKLASPEQVRPRVADVREVRRPAAAVDLDRGDGRAHPGHRAVAGRPVEHGPVGVANPVGKRRRLLAAHDLHGKRRRHLAAPVAAHAVGHDVQGRLGPEGVLVALTCPPDVRRRPHPELHSQPLRRFIA